MPNVYVLYWFDVEDCTVPQSDDANKRLANILAAHGVRGTFKVVGQKARLFRQRVRYDVIDALQKHTIGFHSHWHGLRPQIAEYLGPLDWHEGVAEFDRRETPGLMAVRRLFGQETATYGQPGSNWAPHVFPILRKWGIPTYVSGFGYIGLDCQPFWLGGILCTSHMYGQRLSGEKQGHLMGLNFELGKPGEIEKHKAKFTQSLEQLSATGGLISIINHPCTLVLEQWFSTYLKPRELTEAGYAHFDEFVKWSVSHPNVKGTCAKDLLRLYPDRAQGRTFSRDEIRELAARLSGEIGFQRLGDVAVSAAEAFGLLVNGLGAYAASGGLPAGVEYAPVYNQTRHPKSPGSVSVSWPTFSEMTRKVMESVKRTGEVPNSVDFKEGSVAPADYMAAVARVLVKLLDGGKPPEKVDITPVERRFEAFVDEDAGRAAWKSVMMPPDFTAPKLIDLAKLVAWTLKPAILKTA